MMTMTFAAYPPICGRRTHFMYAPRSPRIAAPALAFTHIFFTQCQKIRMRSARRKIAPPMMDSVSTG